MLKSIMSLSVIALVQANQHHPHKLVQHHGRVEDPFYKETKAGTNWFDLDDPSERLHGTQVEDTHSPYDPDVADAPEDLPRVGNDHQALVNAKLSPNGYYNGFFHKDFEGVYAQKRAVHF